MLARYTLSQPGYEWKWMSERYPIEQDAKDDDSLAAAHPAITELPVAASGDAWGDGVGGESLQRDSIPTGAPAAPTAPVREWQAGPTVMRIQRRTVRMLVAAQIVGGVGIGASASLSALLAEAIAGSESMAGLARTCTTLGAAAVALPLALLARKKGRNSALGLGWTIASIGGITLVVAATIMSLPLLILGMLMFGCGSAVNLQSRYAAIDLARPTSRGKTLSLVVWSTTVGSVVGPNLATPGADVAGWFGLPPLSGGFLISSVVLVFGALAMFVFMRPDPLLTAQQYSGSLDGAGTVKQRNLRVTMHAIGASPVTRFAFVTIALGHTVMAAVMTMTPVHMMNHGSTLTLVGMVISVHVLGMYAFSPVVGILSDRVGPLPTILIGQGIFVLAAIFGVIAGPSTVLVSIGLFLVGLGWSFSLVAGSTLLAESVPESIRPTVQGTSDMVMNLMAAFAAGASGFVQEMSGFAGLNIAAALLTIPVFVLFLGAASAQKSKAPASPR
ncbi:MAG: MFS transporter [Nakamurella sp.]